MAHTSRGKDFLEYDNPYNVGMTGIIGGAAGYHAILDCDVLLLLGADFAWTQFYPDKAKIIQIDLDPTHIGRRHPVTIGAVGNIKATLEALLPRLEQHEDGSVPGGPCGALTGRTGERRKAETVSGPDSAISGTYLDQDHQQARGRRRLVRGGRRHGGGLDASTHRHRRQTPDLRAACCTARWRAGCRRRSGCRSASPAGR